MPEPLKILLIDDDVAIRTISMLALERVGGAQVRLAESGARGLELAADGWADVVLLDMNMPCMDGPETARHLRDLPGCEDLPVIVLTAHPNAETLASLIPNAIGAIQKPFDPMTLTDEIHRYLSAAN